MRTEAFVLRAYEYIINLVDYDSIGLEEQERDKEKDNKVDDLRSIYGVFVNKKVVCAGYARALQYVLNLLGIECMYVRGDTISGGYHAWNIVNIENEYYYIDVTWGDASNTEAEKNYSNEINYNYFCVTTKEISRDHTPDKEIPMPECTSLKCNYHYRHGLYLEEYDFNKIRNEVVKAISSGKKSISFRSPEVGISQEILHKLVDEGKMHEILKYVNLKSNSRVNGSYKYSQSKDMPVINFFFD